MDDGIQSTGSVARRASDAERDHTIAVLNNALAIGQLRPDEHEQRVQTALTAATVGDLGQLVADLAVPPRPEPRWRRSQLLVVGAAAVALVVGLIVATHGARLPAAGAAHRSGATTSVAPPVTGATGVQPSPLSNPLDGLAMQLVPPGVFGAHDPADECGAFGAFYPGGGANCYLVVQFVNTGTSSVHVTPVDVRMVDQTGDTYSVEPVAPACYDPVDVNWSMTLGPHGHLTVQLCYPVMTGALPQSLVGIRTLSGLSLSVPSDSIVGRWGGA